MATRIEERANDSVIAAHKQHRIQPARARHKVTAVGDFAFVTQKEPATTEYPIDLQSGKFPDPRKCVAKLHPCCGRTMSSSTSPFDRRVTTGGEGFAVRLALFPGVASFLRVAITIVFPRRLVQNCKTLLLVIACATLQALCRLMRCSSASSSIQSLEPSLYVLFSNGQGSQRLAMRKKSSNCPFDVFGLLFCQTNFETPSG